MSKPKDWLEKAKTDIQVSQYNFDGKFMEAAAFFTQQAAEKALKAVLLAQGDELIKTHDVTLLSRKVELPNELIIKIGQLNPAYILTRYPDISGKFKPEDVADLIQIAKEVIAWAEKRLSKN